MKKAEQLYRLQEVDSALDRAALQLSSCRARLGDESELLPLRSRLEESRRRLRELESKGRDLEMSLEGATARLKAGEAKLYGGTVKNPKELSALSQDVEAERGRVGRLEEEALLNMDAVEEASGAAEEAQRQYAEAERAWLAAQSALREECDSLQREVDALTARRAEFAAPLDPPTLRIYEGLRRTRGGLAVALVEQRTCKGCRITLSSSEVQRARASADLVFCQSCGRVLYAG